SVSRRGPLAGNRDDGDRLAGVHGEQTGLLNPVDPVPVDVEPPIARNQQRLDPSTGEQGIGPGDGRSDEGAVEVNLGCDHPGAILWPPYLWGQSQRLPGAGSKRLTVQIRSEANRSLTK